MTPKRLHLWITLPYRMFGLVSRNRLERLWYYIRTNQSAIVLDRIKRLLALGTAAPLSLRLYSLSDNPRPIIFPPCAAPLVSIVIPVFNQWETTRACLLSILDNTHNIPYEVIVADDCSLDDTRHLSELAPGVRCIVNVENLGFVRNCNRASRTARGKYLVMLNNDTQTQPGWLTLLVQQVENDPNIGIVGPMLLYPNGQLQEAGGIIWRDGGGWNYGRLDYPERPEYNYLKDVDYISGACILIRKSLWDEIGGFDERFAPAYYEDTDLAFEVRRLGYRVVYQPLSRVVHLEGISHGTNPSQGIKSNQTANKIAFREKWGPVLDAMHGRDPRDLPRARDRSFYKKRLLFIDHYVPMRDQDAGSRSTFQYLTLMSEMGYQITFLGDNFVDYQPYTSELQQLGIEVLFGPGIQRHWKRWLANQGKNFDYVYLSRPHITQKYLPHIRRYSSAKIVYCGHDLHFLREERHFELKGRRTYLRAAKNWARIEQKILQEVDISYFFSSFEIDELNRRFPTLVARAIPLYLFDGPYKGNFAIRDFSNREGLLFVGGFMHEPNVDAVLWFVDSILPLVRKRVPDMTLTIVGSNPPAVIGHLSCDYIHVAGRISDEALLQQYNRTKVVVAPLRYGAGVKGKIVEAMHFGVPTVTTTVGAEGIAATKQALFVADDAETFADAVLAIYCNEETWRTAQQLSNVAVLQQFSKKLARAILSQDMPL